MTVPFLFNSQAAACCKVTFGLLNVGAGMGRLASDCGLHHQQHSAPAIPDSVGDANQLTIH